MLKIIFECLTCQSMPKRIFPTNYIPILLLQRNFEEDSMLTKFHMKGRKLNMLTTFAHNKLRRSNELIVNLDLSRDNSMSKWS